MTYFSMVSAVKKIYIFGERSACADCRGPGRRRGESRGGRDVRSCQERLGLFALVEFYFLFYLDGKNGTFIYMQQEITKVI